MTTDLTCENAVQRRLPAQVSQHRVTHPLTVICIAPLVDYKIKQHLLGYVPLDLDEERLVAGWVQVFGTVMGVL